MASYLIQTIEDLIMAAVILGMADAYVGATQSHTASRVFKASSVLGLLIAMGVAYTKKTTRNWDNGMWNAELFGVSLVVLLLFFVFSCLRKDAQDKKSVLSCGALSVVTGLLLAYALPDTVAAPYTMLQTEDFISTDFLFRMIGLCAGLVVVLVTYFATQRLAQRLSERMRNGFLYAALLGYACMMVGEIVAVLMSRRMLKAGKMLFTFVRLNSNYAHAYAYLAFALLIAAAVVLWVQSLRQQEPYHNPAQRRKILAKWQNIRRWAVTAGVCVVCSVLVMSPLKAWNNRPVELSPIEETVVHDGAVYVALDRVNDGHLHRYAITSPKGKQIRFIVIQKTNKTSYGVGMDACEICGETGYYEKEGNQIVCKLCDVVMNVNTIGFPGGCNPLVVEYKVEKGNIIVPVKALLKHEKRFRKQ